MVEGEERPVAVANVGECLHQVGPPLFVVETELHHNESLTKTDLGAIDDERFGIETGQKIVKGGKRVPVVVERTRRISGAFATSMVVAGSVVGGSSVSDTASAATVVESTASSIGVTASP